MAGSFTLTIRRETAIVSGLKNNATAMAIAESGLAMAEFMLLNPTPNQRWRADGSIYQIDAENTKLRIQLLSETGKINLNEVDPVLLQNLMNYSPTGGEARLPLATINRAAALLDWRDNDDLTRLNGAEQKQYQDAGLNYSPRNKPFQSLEELQMVLGMDAATLNWLETVGTVYVDQPQVDLQLASKDVLQIVSGANAGLIDNYLAARAESARNNLPAPVLPFNTVQATEAEEVTTLTIVSEARLNDQSTAVISAVVKKSDGMQTTPFQVLRWQPSVANNVSLFADTMNELVVKHYAEFEFDH